MKIGKLAGNLKIRNEYSIYPTNKTKNKKEQADNENRYPRVALAKAVDFDGSCDSFVHVKLLALSTESAEAEALSRNKKQLECC